ncbi:hypothetical protein [Blautia sp. An81]|uniref:hypothetical protein n=1 Tax=Blautia sp. An81 TaxID=1965659 RepID=UPI000B3AE417|nr:hypothetical protein [Blautia sp. An81]OUN26545.1 hypothetical protein B5G33_15950 [Blautia sp. An81]
MYYKDDFEKEFREEVDFHKYLEEVDARAKWVRVPSRSLKVLVASGNEECCTPVEQVDMESMMEDTKQHTGLLLKFPGGVYQLGSTAIKTLKGRARIDGTALADVDRKTLAQILNQCLKVAKGKALLRLFEGKVRAVLSGDERDYSILSMPDVYMVSSAYLNGDFEQTNFQLGYADHSTANAIWELQDERMEKVYRDLLAQYGRYTEEKLKAAVRITTSDVGASGANIFYSLQGENRSIILGEAMKVRHKNCKGIEDFAENAEAICTYYKEVLRGVLRLCNIHIQHPANTMAGVMRKTGFSKKLIAETVESYKASVGEEACTAYEVYCGICEALSIARQNGENERSLLKMEERIAKCVSKRWIDFDIPGEVQY